MIVANLRYLAYLLRLWQDIDSGKVIWRASLEDPHTGNRQGFSNIEALIDYLIYLRVNHSLDEPGTQDQEDGTRKNHNTKQNSFTNPD